MISKLVFRSGLAAMCAGALLASGCGSQAAQSPPASAQAAQPASENPYAALARLPDWSGVWDPTFVRPPPGAERPAPPKLTPAYQTQYDKYLAKNRKTPGLNFVSDVASCVPPGLPQSMQQPYPIEFLFTPGRVT